MEKSFHKCTGGKECATEKALNIIDGKWSFLIIKNLFEGTMRFGELRKSLHNISPKTLTLKLKELENHGVLTRTLYPTIPPMVEYALTPKGCDLIQVINAMKAWGEKWA